MPQKIAKISIVLASILSVNMIAMTLEDVSKDVFNTNPEIKERLEHYRDTKHDYEISKSGFLPKIDFTATAGKERYKNAQDVKTKMYTNTYGATLNQNIFNGFSNYYDLQAQKNRVLSSELYLKEKSDEILLAITQYYLNSMKKYQQLIIEKENVESHKKTYEKVKERKEVGYSTISELWQAESRYVLSQSNLVSSELAYQDSLANFAKIYGKDIPAKTLIKPEFKLQLPNTIEEALKIAMTSNATVSTEIINQNVVKNQYRGSYSSFYPKIDFDLSATKSENVSGTQGTLESYAGTFKLYYNLFSGFADYQKTRKYLSSVNSQAATMENTRLKVTEKLRLAWDSYTLLTRQLEFLKQHVDLSRKTVDAYNEEFLLGRRTIIDLLGAESEYNSAKREMVGTEYDLLLAKYRVYDVMYGLTDVLVNKDSSVDSDMKSVLFKSLSPSALDSESKIQKALEINKLPKEKSQQNINPIESKTQNIQEIQKPVVPVPQEVKSVNEAEQNQVVVNELKTQEENIVKAESAAPAEIVAPVVIETVKPKKLEQTVKSVDSVVAKKVTPSSLSIASVSEGETCYKVAVDKLLTRQSPSETSKKVGYLMKNWKACSEFNKDGWIKLPNGWANTGFMTLIK